MDSVVRRSDRVRATCNGFKGNVCKARNYLSCSSEPPTLSLASLKKIGTSICQLQPDQVLFKKKKTNPIRKKQKKGKDEKSKQNGEEADKEMDDGELKLWLV